MVELKNYVYEYSSKYQCKEVFDILKGLSERYRIIIFSSFPKLLFCNYNDIVYKIFGSEGIIKYFKIYKLGLINPIQREYTEDEKNFAKRHPRFRSLKKPKNFKSIRKQLNEIGLEQVHNRGSISMGNNPNYVDYVSYCRFLYIEPDRYGMLVYLIDEIIEGEYIKEDVVVLGEGVTTEPIHKLAGRIIENLKDLD